MCLNHVHAAIAVRGNMSRHHTKFILLQDEAYGVKEASLLWTTDTNLRFIAADVQNDIGCSPCLKVHRTTMRG